MYLTVQRVASARGERGINGALYAHHANRDAPMWRAPDIRELERSSRGTQVARRTDVKPGGNSVECFLDIAFPDDLSEPELRSLLAGVRSQLVSSRLDVSTAPVAISFSQNLGEGVRAIDNFDQLQRAAIQLLRTYVSGVQKPATPVDIIATTDDAGWHFELSGPSKVRIQSERAKQELVRVNVPYEVTKELRETYGELHLFVAEWVTHLSRDELDHLGGVRILHEGACVWQWPDTGAVELGR